MKLIYVQQGTPQWLQHRASCVTASVMDKVFAKPTTKAYQTELEELVLDLQGVGRFDFEAPWFEHGRENEPQARLAFEWKFDTETWNDCIMCHDEWDWLRASPDLLWGPRDAPKGGGEIKCRQYMHSYLEAITAPDNKYQGLTRGYYLQIQTCMAISGFPEWRYINYYINMERQIQKLHCRPIFRDDRIIDEIIERSVAFRMEAIKQADLELAK